MLIDSTGYVRGLSNLCNNVKGSYEDKIFQTFIVRNVHNLAILGLSSLDGMQREHTGPCHFCTVIQMLRLLIVSTAQQPQSKGRHFRTFAAVPVICVRVQINIDKRSAQK